MKNTFVNWASCLSIMFLAGSCSQQQQGQDQEKRYPDALSPEESIKKMEVADGFKVEVFAAEPEVWDPVSMEFDEQGNAYVVEMPDYPFKPDPGKEKGRIRVLRDTNGDGRVDQSIVFADKLSEATSVLPWKGGLLVTAAPDILYLKDTNGDFKADTREVLFTGFFKDNPEAQITSLRFGVDNWIYANNRGQAGEITYKKKGGAPLSVRGADFRFRLDRDQFELETGPGQFGQTIDDFGRRFFTENSIHIQHVVIPWRYLHRDNSMPFFKPIVNVSDHEPIMYQQTPPPYWRAQRTDRRNKEYKEKGLDRVEYAEDHFTGSSGGTVYGGESFAKEFYGNVFTADVAGNLVHRDVLELPADSVTFIAKRAASEKEREFIASTDSWFRPTNFANGPDGYLYITDYYRQHIETPVSIPDDLKADMDFLAGSDRGRIYRVMPKDATHKKVNPDLRNATSQKLIETLAHPNQWYRLHAQRLLLERQDKSVIPAAKQMIAQNTNPRARLHALYVLEGLNALDAASVKAVMNDSEVGLRENALMLAERFPECLPQIVEKTNDPSTRVALQATLSLGEFNNSQVKTAMAKILEKRGDNKWFRLAVLSSDAGSSIDFVAKISDTAPWKATFLQDFGTVIGTRYQKDRIKGFLALISQPSFSQNAAWKSAAVKGLATGLGKAEKATPELKEKLTTVKADAASNPDKAIADLKKII